MKCHSKQNEITKLVSHSIPVLLIGEKGSGKSTILINAAKELGIPYSFVVGTRQTTVGNLLGFISVTGIYIPSVFRKAYEEGHLFNIDEIDAMDSNTLLVLNSLENGAISFPDGYNDAPHKDFRLCATANPFDEHQAYTGRSNLDASSTDRFDIIRINRDPDLERSLTDNETMEQISLMRIILDENNSSKTVSMRDSIRKAQRKQIGLDNEAFNKNLMSEESLYTLYV